MASAYAEIPWDGICKESRLRWNRARCAAYVITIPLATLQPIVHRKLWFYWYLFAPAARGLMLLAAIWELRKAPPWKVCLLAAATLFAIDPPWGEPMEVIHRAFAVLYAMAFLAGLQPQRTERAGFGDRPLRAMMTAMAFLEVVYFTGGWAWPVWWLFPAGQTAAKLGSWGWHSYVANDSDDTG